jgi:glycosyltransferase involved in cell wall biosynthesis/spore coat polysaccharide biosynthesis protein SpsF (cytidylyltransferase family)
MSTARIIVVPDLFPRFDDSPNPLLARWGASSTVLEATLDRLVASALAPVIVCYRDAVENRALGEVLRDKQVTTILGPRDRVGLQLAALAVEQSACEVAILVDAAAPFVSRSVLRQQLESHLQHRPDLTLCSLAARGLSGVIVEASAITRLASAYLAERRLDPDITLMSFILQARASFNVTEVTPPDRFICIPVSLAARGVADVEALSAHALPPEREDYEPVFTQRSAVEWNRFQRPPRSRPLPARPKILFVNYVSNRQQGTTRCMETILQHWDRARYEIATVLPCRGELYDLLSRDTTVHLLPFRWSGAVEDVVPGSRQAEEVLVCAELLARERPDLVYLFNMVTPLAMACRMLGIPTVCHMHLPFFALPPGPAAFLAARAILPLYDLVIAPSLYYDRLLRDRFFPPDGRLVCVQNGIELGKFAATAVDARAARARFSIPEGAKVVTVCGRLMPDKRPELAVEALPEIVRRIPDAILAFAGEERGIPGYLNALKARAASLGVAERVRFLGFIDDTPSVYAATDVLLHCAPREMFGLILVEAMAMGKPIVAIDEGGPREIVVDGVTGRLIPPPGAAADAAAAVAEILADPARAEQLGSAGRRRANEHFEAKTFTRRLESLCDGLM